MTGIPQAATDAAVEAIDRVLDSEYDPSQPGAMGRAAAEAAAPHIAAAAVKLQPAENMILTIAKGQLKRGENPPINTTTMLVMIIERLAGIRDYTLDPAEPVAGDVPPGELGAIHADDQQP